MHADDLANACQLAAAAGKRITDADPSSGVYYPADDVIFSYAELGRLIGKSLGRQKTRVLGVPLAWCASAAIEIVSRLRRHPTIVNWDKAREAAAGSWICSNVRLKNGTGFQVDVALEERITQAVRWYRRHGWLK